ncbi:likely GTP/GDP exchange factor for ARF [Theileria orientalis strain Shintoku]|uniref:Likely GTP/GDP exchange factor for ARF n=1 Tax=Theileria orientalis strain Shintoku TaxID=869250 RepID=J4CDT1_THEOR|nr:likely GTP/GDP exchange factor for ARF [Theileria orientalis strain Shintoku]BAM41682.1 likely GTP/GDP exchange factor for ARF [Theileria orientalis strain Shintoku]|eukprot:XP_009691983.1 likely GTP/GDP exchange factor for ARF [Theileria orientalis strain Shintoku]
MEREETESLDASTANRNYLNRSLAIRVIKNDAYNVLSVLRSYVNNISGYSATSNLVPILGADATVLKTNEQKLIKKFKKLASAEEDESKHLEMEHLEPFFEVFKTFDNRHIKLLIMCVDALTNMAKSDLLCFEEEEAYESMNKMFGEVLNCFSSASELKEDFLLFKAFDCIGSIYRSHYGNMVNNENTCSMLKRFMTLMSNRNKNSFYKKVMYTKMNEVLLSAFGNERRYERYETDFYRRVNSIFLYVSLMTGLTNQFNYLGYHMEDTYLYIGDRDTMMSLRAHLTPILNGLTSTPTYFNEFTEEMKRMGLGVMLNALEWNLVNLSNANMVPIMQAHLTHSMYKLIFTDSITMYSLVLRSLRNLFNNFRYNLKAQMELFISHLISSVTAHVMEPKRTRADIVEMNMEFLGEFARNADMLVELYLNYDCDLKCTNVYGALVKCLLGCISNCEGDYSTSKSDQAKAKKTTPMKTTTKKTTQQYKAISGAGEAMPQINTEYFALGVIQSIIKYMLTDHKLYINTNPNGCITAQQTHTEYDKLKERAYKDKLVECSIEFNEAKSNKWMERGREMGVFSKNYTEKEVAVFLKNAPELDMNKVGEYLATHKNQEFMDKVRRTFCELNHFAGMPIVMAIRLFLSSFRLPGESQQIERLIEIFSKVYFTAQPLVEQTKESGRRGSMVEGEQAEEETDELKMARWVIQEEFYHKYKAIQQNCKQTALTSVSLNNMRGSSEHWVGDEPDHSELREASSWTSNTEMYDYFLANDTEGLVSSENYRKICEYLKNTPVTLETQTTYNDSIPASNAEAEGANREESTQRSGGTESSRNTQSIGSIWTESQVNDQGPTSTKVKIENKNGFAYIQDYNAIFVLCYSIIMLNTDLHNNQIKNKMKLEDFIRNNRGTNDGKNFSTEFLKDIYNTIKYHEIKLHSTHSPNNSKYEPYLWSDYVLQRQNKLSQYVQLTRHEEKGDEETRKKRAAQRLVLGSTDGSAHLKLKLLEELLESRLLEVLDNLFSNCRTIEMLKKIVELLWLLVRVALKHGNHELMNEVFQLTSVDVSYGLGYKCQISISFALNVMALASEHFDTKSWAKALDIVTRLYCLNLLPATFGALDGDGRLFSSYWSDLTVPSIRFKRLTDRRTSNWLVGLSNLMPFTKVGYGTEGAKGGKKEADGECDETFLFLFDVQMSTKDLLQNKFFDVYLLRNKFSPIYSSEDEATINNVTKTLSSESDREELLPPILTYINLRLAFLNIYKLDDLFMGTITNAELKSFKQFLAVITRNIFKVLVPFQESPRDRDSFRERDSFGNILDPNVMELDRFRAKISAIFNLGIFSRLALHVLTTGTSGTSGTASGTTSEEKRRQLLRCFVEVFYNLSRKLVVKSALEHLPSKEEIYARFGLKDAMAGPEYVRSEYEHEGMEEPLSNYVAFILLNLVLWFVDYFNDHKDMESPTSRSRHAERPGAASDANQNANSNTDPTGNQNCKLDGTLMDLSTWLLHLFINFENKTFNAYLDPMEKLMYNLADSACIAKNKYIVTIMMCAIQRMVNPYLPFGTEQFRKETSKTSGSILTLLLRRSKCLSWNDEYVARLTAQTLLSIGLYSNKTMVPEKEGTASNQRKHGSAPGQDQKNVKEKYAENLLAIQLLIEFNSFAGDENKENLERLWLLSLHSLSILFSIGPREISNEAIKGLNKLLLQQKYPETRCSFTSQVSRIFDHVLAPMLTHNFSYPLPPETEKPLREKRRDRSSANNNYRLANPFQTPEHTNEGGEQWMTRFLSEYINNYAFSDYNDLATRKAAATNLVCHALLSKLNELMTDHQEEAPEEALKASGSSLDDHKEVCEHNCVKRLLVFTQYVLNVIIPSNGEDIKLATAHILGNQQAKNISFDENRLNYGRIAVLTDKTSRRTVAVELKTDCDIVASTQLFESVARKLVKSLVEYLEKRSIDNSGERTHIVKINPGELDSIPIEDSKEDTLRNLLNRTSSQFGKPLVVENIYACEAKVDEVIGSYTHKSVQSSTSKEIVGTRVGLVTVRNKEISKAHLKQLADLIALQAVGDPNYSSMEEFLSLNLLKHDQFNKVLSEVSKQLNVERIEINPKATLREALESVKTQKIPEIKVNAILYINSGKSTIVVNE